MDVIVIDYYMLLDDCLEVVVIINFCYFVDGYFLFNFFGVVVVFKLVEVFYN